jgi:hypothetical protein
MNAYELYECVKLKDAQLHARIPLWKNFARPHVCPYLVQELGVVDEMFLLLYSIGFLPCSLCLCVTVCVSVCVAAVAAALFPLFAPFCAVPAKWARGGVSPWGLVWSGLCFRDGMAVRCWEEGNFGFLGTNQRTSGHCVWDLGRASGMPIYTGVVYPDDGMYAARI